MYLKSPSKYAKRHLNRLEELIGGMNCYIVWSKSDKTY